MSGPGPAAVRWFERLDSTNRYLADEARRGAAEGLVAVADHQSAGRGRLGRRWESPPGANLLCSVLLRPALAPADLPLTTVALALAGAAAAREVAGVAVACKWPNDLVVGERKVAGILAEAVDGPGGPAVVAGIGVNLAWPGPPEAGGTCLDGEAGRPVDRRVLLDALLSALWPRRALLDTAEGRADLVAELAAGCVTLGREVRVELAGGRSFTGRAEGLGPSGQLLVATGGEQRSVAAGDVVHLRAPEGGPPGGVQAGQ